MVSGLALGAASLAGGALNFFEQGKQAEIAQAITDARLEALENKIDLTRINAVRKVAQQQGLGRVAAGARNVQFSGSVAAATRQAIQETEFQKINEIQNLRLQQRITALGGEAQQLQASSQQAGGVVSAATQGVTRLDQLGDAKQQGGALDSILNGTGINPNAGVV